MPLLGDYNFTRELLAFPHLNLYRSFFCRIRVVLDRVNCSATTFAYGAWCTFFNMEFFITRNVVCRVSLRQNHRNLLSKMNPSVCR
jgi:hypothetical protein